MITIVSGWERKYSIIKCVCAEPLRWFPFHLLKLKAQDLFFPSLSFRDVEKLGSQMRKSAIIQQQSIKTEWKLAKIAFVVIIVFVLSWSPYACVTLIAWAG